MAMVVVVSGGVGDVKEWVGGWGSVGGWGAGGCTGAGGGERERERQDEGRWGGACAGAGERGVWK